MSRRRWTPGSTDAIESLLFTGAPKLIKVVEQELLHRSRNPRVKSPLPIVYLVTTGPDRSPLVGIEDRLNKTHRTVNCKLALDTSPPSSTSPSPTITDALNAIVAGLAGEFSGAAKLKFPHYSLAVWLSTLAPADDPTIQPDQMDRAVDNKLAELIKTRFPVTGDSGAHTDLVNEFPLYIRVLARMKGRLAMGAMRLFWRPPRWLAKKHNIGEGYARSFRTLTRAFMADHDRQTIGGYQVSQLLIDAFLEDLCRAYRRTTLFGRGRRRTSYPVLLIDVPADPGSVQFELLNRIAQARDDAGQRTRPPAPYRADPLLVIAAGPEVRHETPGRECDPIESAADMQTAYNEWLRQRPQARNSWRLPLRVSRPDPPEAGARDAVTGIELTPPRASRIASIVLVAALVAIPIEVFNRTYHQCGTWYWDSNLDREGGQCVGLAPPGYRFFDGPVNAPGVSEPVKKQISQDLRDVEDRINASNDQIVDDGAPYHTAVYLSNLSPGNIAGYRWELEQLRGIEIAQNELRDGTPIRVLLANAGNGMDYGRIAAESIADEAAEEEDDSDTELIGVLGLGISRTGTREALMRLDRARIPMIGTFISATPLAETTTEYYHQVGPTNRRESGVAAHYAKVQLKATKVEVYYLGDSSDLYSSDLRNQVHDAFTREGIEVKESPYKIAPGDAGIDLGQLGRQACDLDDHSVAFYAGRAEHLPAFLKGMRGACDEYPKIISGDDATRFVLANGLRNYPGLSLDYLSFGSSLAWGPDCSAAPARSGFFPSYADHYGATCARTRDGSAILAYDSMQALDQAVRNAPQDDAGQPTTDGVLAGLNKISVAANGALRGASGVIDFGKGGHPVPVNKAVMILRANSDGDPERQLLCGEIPSAQPPPDTAKCPSAEE